MLGAWYLASRFTKDEPVAKKSGLPRGRAAHGARPGDARSPRCSSCRTPRGGDPGVYLVPPDLLLEGPNGEYVFAADAMAAGSLAADLGRVVNAPIDAVYTRARSSDLGALGGHRRSCRSRSSVRWRPT